MIHQVVKNNEKKFENIFLNNLDQDQLTKITNIFCAEIDKPSNPQRQVLDEEIFKVKTKEDPKNSQQTERIQPRASESIEEGKTKKFI